ncbi:hypothetical protein GTZ99_10295 [Novosphingobium sp. FSY-8]|uniref:Putative Flp pilus-assembly TadG-like N-terminal domain-containing protein n=1 Tax=Novosphingobium ovatum TaxID=1908523 RepID=A0ABW9XEJ5_9SPHN|nr:pilus assembly protein TadG-related protein [Novosphingobium ovatum]NBC36946.1 hypothetical protein [Novosphingobium ovatum]
MNAPALIRRLIAPFAAMHVLARRLRDDTSGNVLMIAAGVLIPLTFAVGFGVDYARVMKVKSQFDAAADSAALIAVSATNMQNSQGSMGAVSRKMFTGHIGELPSVSFNQGQDLNIDISTVGALNNGRLAVVTWRAKVNTLFGSLLGLSQWPISGVAKAQATKAPYMNFYLVLDTSPSMLLATTSTGISALRAVTAPYSSNPGYGIGCAFACHVQNPSWDGVEIRTIAGQRSGVPGGVRIYIDPTTWTSYAFKDVNNAGQFQVYNPDGTTQWLSTTISNRLKMVDSWWIARNMAVWFPSYGNVNLRLDDSRAAVQQLIPYAGSQATANGVVYKMQMYGFDYPREGQSNSARTLTSSMADFTTMSASSVPDLAAAEPYLYSSGCPTTTYCNNAVSTRMYAMLGEMNTAMATPGDGLTASSPQGVMLLITDGMPDDDLYGGRYYQYMTSDHLARCTAIKNRGIRIAILYTEYVASSIDYHSGVSWLVPLLPTVETQLKACASVGSDGSPLFYKVTTNQSIPTALQTLFSLTVQQSHLVQ